MRNTTKQVITPNWIRPNLENERGELERVISEFLAEEPTDNNIRKIKDLLESSPIMELFDKEWESLENTESFHDVKPNHIEDAEKITEEYNQDLSPENKRNFKKILDGFIQGKEIEAPIILKNKEGKLHLVSGNTRLMIARALGVRPKVVMGQIT